MLIRALLVNNESGTNPSPLKETLETFARRKGHRVGAYYNDKPATPNRSNLFQLLRDKGLAIASPGHASPTANDAFCEELFRLVQEARPGDVLLVERIEMLKQLGAEDWQAFRQKVAERKIRVVSLDVEASWVMVTGESAMAHITEQLTAMMLDMLQLQGQRRKKDEKRRHLDGIARAKAKGKYKGRPVDREKHERILELLKSGNSWSEVCRKTGASRSTVARVVKSDS